MLAGMWGIVFLPSLLKMRRHSSPVASVTCFNKSLQALGSGQVTTGGRWVVMPPAPPLTPSRQSGQSSAVGRRRKVFTGLVAICGVTLALGLVPALHWVLWIHLLADLVLAAMIALLVGLRAMSDTPIPYMSAPSLYGPAELGPGSARFQTGGDRGRSEPVGNLSEAQQANYPAPLQPVGKPGRFEPAGHGYRMVGETLENPLIYGGQRRLDPPSIKVYRTEDPPAVRLSPRPHEVMSAGTQSRRVGSFPAGRPEARAGKPRMFLDDEEDFLEAQGL